MKIIAEYIWIDGYQKLRGKTKVFNLKLDSNMKIDLNINTFPLWNYDGSSTNQANGSDSEVGLIPVSFYKDCFRNNEHCYFVLCRLILKIRLMKQTQDILLILFLKKVILLILKTLCLD